MNREVPAFASGGTIFSDRQMALDRREDLTVCAFRESVEGHDDALAYRAGKHICAIIESPKREGGLRINRKGSQHVGEEGS